MRWGLCCVAAALLACGSASAGAGGGWEQIHVRTIQISYRTHDGLRRAAYVLVPDWYGPDRHPRLPLIISPHGRGVSADANAERWGDLPAAGAFAVVNPEGQGRLFARFSWGYPGQIEDLARMPAIVRRAVPWLRIDTSRVYAMGASMGGQESLLLLGRRPSLLAGVAAFDPVTDMARRYRDFQRLGCNTACRRQWGAPLGKGLRLKARAEIGGTPRSARRAYAQRSPITFARRIARSGVPVQLWWSKRDRVVDPRDQSVPFARALRRYRPRATLRTVVGRWPHSAAMHPYSMLVPALKAFGLFPTRGTTGLRAGPLHRLLPWHRRVRDANGRLLPWYRPSAGLGYDHVLRLGWNFIERRSRDVQLRYAVFDGSSLRGIYWQHNPAFVNAGFVDSLVAWYAYSGDRLAVAAVRRMLDYHLAHGTTPAGWAWPRVPFATACAGARTYGRCLAGMPRSFYGGIEPDKVGLLGRGYLLFHELTGERRYLTAALRAANALARHVRAGDTARTPWPFRADARSGRVLDGAQFGGAVIAPIRLFDDLIQLGLGNTSAYQRARDLAWTWLLRVQLPRNDWSGFYEDVPYNRASRNQVPPTLTALYLLDDPSRDPEWQEHVAGLLGYVRARFGRGPFAGAWAIDEQRAPGRPGCCSPVGLGSTTSRWAVAKAAYAVRTGDATARDVAVRSLSYATYFARSNGLISCCGQRSQNTYWFSDGYADYLRSFNWAMAWLPELAPKRQNHVLGSTSVVRAVSYGRDSVAYTTFAPAATDVLRLRFRPARVSGGTFTVEPAGGGDYVVRVRHEGSRRIVVSG
ncbi:MAG: alpha/beta hydrolase family protein [Gaiellaceae bacterium]